ncbi:putative protein kinase RLK-Pelle-URK-2 family [Dioscorea sansibarensis]
MIVSRWPFKIFTFLIITFIKVQALPNNSTVCGVNFGRYPYKPVGECVNKEDGEILVWEHVHTSRCCLNSLKSITQALALFSTGNPQIFLPEDQWQACASQFHSQGNYSFSSCGFDILHLGKGKCSNLTLDSFKVEYGNFYNPVLENCSQFNVPDFDTQCSGCVEGISRLIDHVTSDLQVRGIDFEEEICSIATIIAIVSSGITNDTWVRDLYTCLPAMDTEDLCPDDQYLKIKHSDIKAVLVAAVGVTGMVLLIVLIKYVAKSSDKPIEGKIVSKWSGLYRFSKAEIEKAINYGNNKVCLGAGSAGRVYQGVLPSGQLVAVKHIYKTAMTDSFNREVEGLWKIRHPNLVSLFGCCTEDGEQYLVYEYCSNGNLAHNLLRGDAVLPWVTRVKILRNCALALRFLHTHPDGCTVHRDIKLTNILLTEDMEPKLSDFGLAKLIGMEESKVFTDVRGTIGYMDPEYMTSAQITCASDIYSFGIVTLQVLSGRKVIELDINARDRLTKKAKDVVMGKRPLEDFIDPRLNGELNVKDFESILRIAVLSVASSSKGRPTVKDVFDEMNKAFEDKNVSSMNDQPSVSPSTMMVQPDVISRSRSLEVIEV